MSDDEDACYADDLSDNDDLLDPSFDDGVDLDAATLDDMHRLSEDDLDLSHGMMFEDDEIPGGSDMHGGGSSGVLALEDAPDHDENDMDAPDELEMDDFEQEIVEGAVEEIEQAIDKEVHTFEGDDERKDDNVDDDDELHAANATSARKNDEDEENSDDHDDGENDPDYDMRARMGPKHPSVFPRKTHVTTGSTRYFLPGEKRPDEIDTRNIIELQQQHTIDGQPLPDVLLQQSTQQSQSQESDNDDDIGVQDLQSAVELLQASNELDTVELNVAVCEQDDDYACLDTNTTETVIAPTTNTATMAQSNNSSLGQRKKSRLVDVTSSSSASLSSSSSSSGTNPKKKINNPSVSTRKSELERMERNWKAVYNMQTKQTLMLDDFHSYENMFKMQMSQCRNLYQVMQAHGDRFESFQDVMARMASTTTVPDTDSWLLKHSDRVQQLAMLLEMNQVRYTQHSINMYTHDNTERIDSDESDDDNDGDGNVIVDEYTMRVPNISFSLDKSSCLDNTHHTQFVMAKINLYYLWCAFHTTHARMRYRGYRLLKGYPDMNFDAFVRTFMIKPRRAQAGEIIPTPGSVAAVDYMACTAYGPHPLTRVMSQEDILYAETCHHSETVVHSQHIMTVQEDPIRVLLATYFAKDRVFATHQHAAGTVHVPACMQPTPTVNYSCSNDQPFVLKSEPRGFDILYVFFARVREAHPLLFNRLNTHIKKERQLHNQFPLHGVVLLLDAEPNVKFTPKLDGLYSERVHQDMRCEFDIWSISSMWIDPYAVQCVSRHELMPAFTPEIQKLLETHKPDTTPAIRCALSYRRLVDTDIICRFLGFQRGNIVKIWNQWNQSERNAVPHLVVSIHDTDEQLTKELNS